MEFFALAVALCIRRHLRLILTGKQTIVKLQRSVMSQSKLLVFLFYQRAHTDAALVGFYLLLKPGLLLGPLLDQVVVLFETGAQFLNGYRSERGVVLCSLTGSRLAG